MKERCVDISSEPDFDTISGDSTDCFVGDLKVSPSLVVSFLFPSVLTLAKLHVLVLTSFIKLIKLLQNLMKLLPNHIMV